MAQEYLAKKYLPVKQQVTLLQSCVPRLRDCIHPEVAFSFHYRYIPLIPEGLPFVSLIKVDWGPASRYYSRMGKASTWVCNERRQQEVSRFTVSNLGMAQVLEVICNSEHRNEGLIVQDSAVQQSFLNARNVL